jgi:hypothetical protein
MVESPLMFVGNSSSTADVVMGSRGRDRGDDRGRRRYDHSVGERSPRTVKEEADAV